MNDSTSPASTSREPSPWLLWARSETGKVRTVNEDRMGWVRTSYGDVYVVSDGMGGYRGGALAAELTVNTLQTALTRAIPDAEFPQRVRKAFLETNETVYKQRNPADPETAEMGATAVVLITNGARFMVAHVGDSRAYRWRRRSGLRRLTQDHTKIQNMLDRGLITPEQAKNHPDSSLLVRAIGHGATVEPDVSEWQAVEPGDVFLLCSDGLSGYVSDREINTVLQSKHGPKAIANALVERALKKGGEDNVTVKVLCYTPRRRSVIRQALRPTPVLFGALTFFIMALAWMAYRQDGELRGAYELLQTQTNRITAQKASVNDLTNKVDQLTKQLQTAKLTASVPPPTTTHDASKTMASAGPTTSINKGKDKDKNKPAAQHGAKKNSPAPTNAGAAADTPRPPPPPTAKPQGDSTSPNDATGSRPGPAGASPNRRSNPQ